MARRAKGFAAVYAREFRGDQNERMLGTSLKDVQDAAIAAGDNTDSDLGTLSGSLVAQKTLELLKFQFPILSSVTSDFSDESARYGQTIITRTVEIPNVQTYNTSTGWADSDADTADVPVTIDHHVGTPITFNSNIISATVRRLFEEFAPASAYALAKDMADSLYALITDANFPHNTVKLSSAMDRATVIALGEALTLRGAPLAPNSRSLLLWPAAFSKLQQDSQIVQLAAYQRPAVIEVGTNAASAMTIDVDSFSVYSAPNLPANNGNVNGFGYTRSALVIASRVPNDYTKALPGSSYGNVQMISDLNGIGVSAMLTQYVNHSLGTATSRISLMYGVAAGQSDAGQLLKSASGTGSSQS